METLVNTFALSPEQQDTAVLLRRLLGKAITDRYIDFCRLAVGAFPLIVSRPMAAHALGSRRLPTAGPSAVHVGGLSRTRRAANRSPAWSDDDAS
jgi:hypothetical protein